MNTDFDYLKQLHDAARACGRGSKAYFVFCEAMFDGFPAIYDKARNMNLLAGLIDWRLIETAPKDGTEIELFIRHTNFQYANTGDKNMWQQVVVGKWIDFNGGGWTWHGLAGDPVAWRPLKEGETNPQPFKSERRIYVRIRKTDQIRRA